MKNFGVSDKYHTCSVISTFVKADIKMNSLSVQGQIIKVHQLQPPKSKFLTLEKSQHADTQLRRMENHKLTEIQQYNSVGETKNFGNIEKAD